MRTSVIKPATGMSANRRDGDDRLRHAHGVGAVRRVTRHSHGVAVHLLDIDVLPGQSWNDLSSDVSASVSIVLAESGGSVETRLVRAVPNGDSRSTMSFTPRAAPLWGYSASIRHVRELRLDFDPDAFVARVDEPLPVPGAPRLIRDERLRTLASYLAAECERPGAGARLYVDSLTVAVCLDALRAAGPPLSRAPAAGALSPQQLRRAVDLLQAHAEAPIGLEQLASQVGLSPSWFGRAFKASTGLTPYQWQLNVRIEKAQALLSAGQPAADVALATGFSEQSHFSRVFRQRTGTTPGKWRAAHRRHVGRQPSSR